MAKNPMQRKAQNSFLLGILITILITGAVIALLFMQLKKVSEEMNTLKANRVSVCVLNKNVLSGQAITQDLVKTIEVDKNTVPSNAYGNSVSSVQTYALETVTGLEVTTSADGKLVVPDIDPQTKKTKTDSQGNIITREVTTPDGENYYYADTGEKIELATIPMLAKVDMNANTVITNTLVVKSSEKITDDVRQVEYNMFSLPMGLINEEYVDIRLELPSGADYIVASHKQVEIPIVDGIDSINTIFMNVDETEILMLNCAIVESYQIPGSKLYVTRYVEPGLQEAGKTTYVPSDTIKTLIQVDPNCVATARQGLLERLNTKVDASGHTVSDVNRPPVQNQLNANSEDAKDNLQDKVQQEITTMQQQRQQYLEALTKTK